MSSSLPAFFAHHGVMAPGVRLFRVIGFPAKAAWVAVAFLLPLTLLGASLWHTATATAEFSAKERLGVEYARPLLTLLDAAQQRRRAAVAGASGAAELPAANVKADAAFVEVARQQQRLGLAFNTGAAFQRLQSLQQALAAQPLPAPAAASPAATFAAHTAYTTAVIDLLADVADGSNLTLDPDLDSFYLMDAALARQPLLVEALGQLHGLGNALLRGAPMTIAQRDTLSAQWAFAGIAQAGLRKSLGRATAAVDKARVAQLDDRPAVTASQAFLAVVERLLLSDRPSGDAAAFLALGNQAIDAHYALSARVLAALDAELQARVAQLRQTLWLQLGGAVAGVALGVYLLVAFYRVTQGGLAEVARTLKEISQGNLTLQPRPWGHDEAARLMSTLADTIVSLQRVVRGVRQGAGEIEAASSEIASASMDLSARTEQTAAQLQRTTAAMAQITGTVRQTADTASGASSIVSRNAEVATRGGTEIGDAVRTMDGIRNDSGRMADIIGVIDSIAFQTNILALNAAVEAARAGEQGRGFAVVAAEVRSLAQRTAGAAREVKTLIQSSVARVDSGARVVGEAGVTMQEIVANADRIKGLIRAISNAAAEQTGGLDDVQGAVRQIDATTQQNATLVEQTAAAAATLKDSATRLNREMAYFHLP